MGPSCWLRGVAVLFCPLSGACARWRELEGGYDCGRVRVLLAAAYRDLGDADGAELGLAAVAEVFDPLGAAPDGAAVAALRGVPDLPGGPTGGRRRCSPCCAPAGYNIRPMPRGSPRS